MAKKLTKRKAFTFLRSYFDVLNELKDDSDKLDFLLSIINKQFLNEDPKDLNFISNLCYESQRHAIESSVKGWLRATNTDMKGNPMTTPPTPLPTHPPTLPKEEKEEEKEEEEYIYSEKEFLIDWSKCRQFYLKNPTNIKKLNTIELSDFKNILKDYNDKDVKDALNGLFQQKNKSIGAMFLKPKHFLENFDKYLNAELSKDYSLYGENPNKNNNGRAVL